MAHMAQALAALRRDLMPEREQEAHNADAVGIGPEAPKHGKDWIERELATSSGVQTIWATGDDSEQASYVNGKLQVCSRTAACATSTRWLMPAGRASSWRPPTIRAPSPGTRCRNCWRRSTRTRRDAPDVTGQAAVTFRFPFTDGVTEILFNADTDQLVGYVRNGTETVIAKEGVSPGPGIPAPACTPHTGCGVNP